MAEVFCNTSPLQYLHQLRLLHILPALVKGLVVPPAVVDELAKGRDAGVDLPDIESLDWMSVRTPKSVEALPLVGRLGPGETEVLMLALEAQDAIVLMDDFLARKMADAIHKPVKGTLGLLLDAKKNGLIDELRPQLDRLEQLGFRMSEVTRSAVLDLAGELD